MWEQFTPEAQQAILAAQIEAQREGRREVSPAHLLLGALDCSAASPQDAASAKGPLESETALNGAATVEPAPHSHIASTDVENTAASEAVDVETADAETAAARTVLSLDVEPSLLRLAIQTRLRGIALPSRGSAEPRLSRAAKRSLEHAADEARRLKAHRIGTEHLLLGTARTRTESMPWGMGFLWYLRSYGLISDAQWRGLWHRTRSTHLVVAELLQEFRLDMASLRIAAASQTSAAAALKWTNEVQRAIERAQKEARATGAGRVGAEHLWLGLLAEPTGTARLRLNETALDAAVLEKHLRAALRSDNEITGAKIRYSGEARRAFVAAERLAHAAHFRYVGGDHLLLALIGAVKTHENALDRTKALIAGETASRADAAIARALQEQGLDEVLWRRELVAGPPKSPAARREDITARVIAIVAAELDLPESQVGLDTLLFKEAHTHLTILDTFKACKREFGVTFAPPAVNAISTVGELSEFVSARISPDRLVAETRAEGADDTAAKPGLAALPSPETWRTKTKLFFLPTLLWLCINAIARLNGSEEWVTVDSPGLLVMVALPCACFIPYMRSPEFRARFRALSRFFLAGWLVIMGILIAIGILF